MYSAALCFKWDHAHVDNFVEARHALAVFREESALVCHASHSRKTKGQLVGTMRSLWATR